VLAGIGDKVMRKHDTAQTERIIAGVLGSAEAGDVTARVFGRLARDAGNDPESLVAVLRRRRQPPYTVAELATLAMPVLVAIGDADFEYPATELVAAIPRASVAILPGVDHFRTPESFSFIDALLGFLSRQRVDG
jgi:pimeloyl-ACP methyl ester carboxylesterase